MMEQSKLISVIIAKLKIAYPYYFKDLTDEEFAGLFSLYQEELIGYNEETITSAIKYIIRQNKFMPTIKEILDECEKHKTNKQNYIIKKMIDAGYFHDANEIDKTYRFIEQGIIPDWLLNDMKKYGYIEENTLLTNQQNKLLGTKEVTQ